MRNRTMEDYAERLHLENERLRGEIKEKDEIVRHTIRSAVQNKITTQDRQRVIDRARAVAASWKQFYKAPVRDMAAMWGFVEGDMKQMIFALDAMDADAITASSSPEGSQGG